MIETKEISIPIEGQDKAKAKLVKDGWRIVGYGFAPEGPAWSLVKLELEREKRPVKPKPRPKPKKATKKK